MESNPETRDPKPETDESVWLRALSVAERNELTVGRGEIRHTTPDVLVVGGGLIGMAVAWYLAEQGARVQLIEQGNLASGASGANAGGVWPNDQGPAHSPGFQDLSFLSRDLWGRLSLRPGFDFDWRVNGLLNVQGERSEAAAAELASGLQEQGYAVQAVDGRQIANLEPNLCAGLKSGLHYPSEAHVHPVKGALSLARAARARGAGINPGVAALGCDGTERITAVRTTAGTIVPGQVVSATGWTAGWLGPRAEHPGVPVRPVGGQLIATDPLPPLLGSAVVGKFLVLQLRSGEVITGGSLRESDDLAPDPALSAEFADAARSLIPDLRNVPFPRAWCGLRPGTPDGLPIVDRAPGRENLWLACGHFKNGVLLAPATGKLLSEWILSNRRPEMLAPFRADRFIPRTTTAS